MYLNTCTWAPVALYTTFQSLTGPNLTTLRPLPLTTSPSSGWITPERRGRERRAGGQGSRQAGPGQQTDERLEVSGACDGLEHAIGWTSPETRIGPGAMLMRSMLRTWPASVSMQKSNSLQCDHTSVHSPPRTLEPRPFDHIASLRTLDRTSESSLSPLDDHRTIGETSAPTGRAGRRFETSAPTGRAGRQFETDTFH